MTLLALDVGNTRSKWRLFDGADGGGVFAEAIPSDTELTALGGMIDSIVCASVRGAEFDRQMKAQCEAFLGIRPVFAAPVSRWRELRSGYRQPSSLGVDRWLAMVAAWHRVGGELIVVDVGTATTLDVVAADGQHLGGYIVPGLNTMVASLNVGTGLIDVELDDSAQQQLGQDTLQAVNHGCAAMLAALINQECVARPHAQLVLTGGGSEALLGALLSPADHRPDLVLEGLYLSS